MSLLSLRKKMLFALVLFAVIPSLVFAAIRVYIGSEKTEELYINRLQSVAHTLSASLDDVMRMCREETLLLSTSWNMREYLSFQNDPQSTAADKGYASEVLTENFVRYTEKINLLDDAVLLNASGQVVLSCAPEVKGLDLSDTEYFKIHEDGYEDHNPDYVFTSRVHDSLTQPTNVEQRRLAFSRCILDDNGALQYVLVLYFNAGRIGAITDGGTYGETGISFAIDESNYVLHHPETRFSNAYTVAPGLTGLISRFNNGEISAAGYMEDVLDGESRMYFYEILPHDNIAVVLRQDYSEFSAAWRNDAVVSLWLLAAALVVTVVAGLLFSKRLAQPVNVLLHKFEDGSKTGRYTANDGEFEGELGSIVSSYNEMVAQMEKQRQEIEREKERSEYLAAHDSLTGLFNRAAFESVFAGSVRDNRSVGLIMLDVYGFKKINNTYGHQVGDEVLRTVARRMEGSAGQFEAVARAGNGQYMLAKAGNRAEIDAALIALHSELYKILEIGNAHIQLTVNIGVAVYPDDGLSIEQLMSNADIAMATARESKLTNHLYFEQSMHERISRTGLVLEVLRDCVEDREIYLLYQPFYDLNDRRVTGFEALMRIKSRQLGILSPMEFIPLAETVPELAVKMGSWALREACRFLRDMIDKQRFSGVVSVNLSPLQIREESFTSHVLAVLDEYNVPGRQLQLEVTEKSVNGFVGDFAPKFNELRGHGISISLDDFGGVRSSFYFLSHLPLDAIKVDQAFFADVKSDTDMSKINKALLEMAKRFDLRVSAERVESQGESDMLKALGFDSAQGYHFSLPLAEHEMHAFLEEHYDKNLTSEA